MSRRPPPDLSDATAIVTGGTRRIGRWLSQGLLAAGADVHATYRRDEESAREFLEEWNQGAADAESNGSGDSADLFTHRADATDSGDWEELLERVVEASGGLDILVNNVGEIIERKLLDTEPEELEHMLQSNLVSAFRGVHTCWETMTETGVGATGAVVNLGCAGAQHLSAKKRMPAYYLAKSALVGMTRTLARELAPKGIRVNMLSPGHTEVTEVPPEVKPRIGSQIPARRMATREDMIEALYLLVDVSDEARYTTGTNLEAGGGWAL